MKSIHRIWSWFVVLQCLMWVQVPQIFDTSSHPTNVSWFDLIWFQRIYCQFNVAYSYFKEQTFKTVQLALRLSYLIIILFDRYSILLHLTLCLNCGWWSRDLSCRFIIKLTKGTWVQIPCREENFSNKNFKVSDWTCTSIIQMHCIVFKDHERDTGTEACIHNVSSCFGL